MVLFLLVVCLWEGKDPSPLKIYSKGKQQGVQELLLFITIGAPERPITMQTSPDDPVDDPYLHKGIIADLIGDAI